MSCCCFLSAKMKAVLSIILILDAMLIRTIHDLVPCKKKKKKIRSALVLVLGSSCTWQVQKRNRANFDDGACGTSIRSLRDVQEMFKSGS